MTCPKHRSRLNEVKEMEGTISFSCSGGGDTRLPISPSLPTKSKMFLSNKQWEIKHLDIDLP